MPSKKVRNKRTKTTRKLVKKPKENHSLSWLVLAFICLQIVAGLIWYTLYASTVLSFRVSPSVSATYAVSGSPTGIVIPSIDIELGVVPANIENGIWQIPDTTAAYLASSAQPGQGGNVIVYAHNKKNLFGSLKQLNVSDVITIKTTANIHHEYEVREIVTVTPEDISIALPTDHEVLTVYTCTGFLDSQRLVIKAYPTKVSSSI